MKVSTCDADAFVPVTNRSCDLRWWILRIWRHLNPRAGKTQAQLQSV